MPAPSVGYRRRYIGDFFLATSTPVSAAVPIAPACSATLLFSIPTDFRAPAEVKGDCTRHLQY